MGGTNSTRRPVEEDRAGTRPVWDRSTGSGRRDAVRRRRRTRVLRRLVLAPAAPALFGNPAQADPSSRRATPRAGGGQATTAAEAKGVGPTQTPVGAGGALRRAPFAAW